MRALGFVFGFLGLLALLAWGLLYAVLKPEGFDWVGGIGVLGLVGVLFFLATSWRALQSMGDDAAVPRFAVAAFASALALGIAVVANIATERYDQRWDLTRDQQYSLTQQSVDLAKKLDRDIEVHAFFLDGSPAHENFKNLMERYEEHTTLLKVSFHDPYNEPMLAEQMKVLSTSGTVILKAGEQTQRLETSFGEEAFTNALVRVTSDTFHPICMVTGHGERDPNDEYGPDGLGIAKIKLEGVNYRVQTVSLLEKGPTPDECTVVVLAGPQTDLAPLERDRLARYVAAGGGLVAMVDPLQAPATAADLARYGVKVGSDVVIEGDPARAYRPDNPTWVLLDPSSYDISPVTEKLQGLAVLGMAVSVDKAGDIPGLNAMVLARASEQSWAETSLGEAAPPAQPDPGQDIVGKVPLAVSVEVTDPAAIRTTTEAPATDPAVPGLALAAASPPEAGPAPKAGGKVVVFGDSDFAGNAMIRELTNQDLFLNAVAWMAGETDQLSIRPNDATRGKLEISLAALAGSAVVSLLIMPGLAIAGMVGTWLHRRKL